MGRPGPARAASREEVLEAVRQLQGIRPPGPTTADIARRLNCDRSTTYKYLQELWLEGLLTKSKWPVEGVGGQTCRWWAEP